MVRKYKNKKLRRKIRTRAKLTRFSNRQRLTVFRSSKYIYCQIIDRTGNVLVAASEQELKIDKNKQSKTERAFLVGQNLAKKAKNKKITEIVFDRSGYQYHGRIKALAEGARKEGLKF